MGALYVLASEHPSHHRSSRGRFPLAFLSCASSFPLTSLASVECEDLLDVDAVEVAQEADKALGTFLKDFGVVPDGYANPLATLLSHHAHQEATAPTHTFSRPYGILYAMKRQAYVQRVGYKLGHLDFVVFWQTWIRKVSICIERHRQNPRRTTKGHRHCLLLPLSCR